MEGVLHLDVPAVLAAANDFAANHPNLALVSFTLNLLAGVTLLAKKICALDLLLIEHVGKRREAIAELPPKKPAPKRRRMSRRPL
jgi:hypothetical protein